MKQILLVFLIFLIVSCNNNSKKEITPKTFQNLNGVYKQVNEVGENFGCEGLVSYFDIELSDTGSSFLYHVFCNPNDFDPIGNFKFKGYAVYGSCSKIDSTLLRLVAYSGEVLLLRINSDRTIDLYDNKGKPTNPGIYFYDTYLKVMGKK